MLDLPGCVAQGETIDEVREHVVDAIHAWEETKRELDGDYQPRLVLTFNLPVPA